MNVESIHKGATRSALNCGMPGLSRAIPLALLARSLLAAPAISSGSTMWVAPWAVFAAIVCAARSLEWVRSRSGPDIVGLQPCRLALRLIWPQRNRAIAAARSYRPPHLRGI